MDTQLDILRMLVAPAKEKPRSGQSLARQARRVRSWFEESQPITERQARRSLRNERYYYGEQLTGEERSELADRGQPDVVFNRVGPSIDLVLGTEIRSRGDVTFLPRGANDEHRSRIYTAIDRKVEDDNQTKFQTSQAVQDAAIAGYGVVFQGLNPNPTGPKILEEWVPWEEMSFDQKFLHYDSRDMRYMMRNKWHRLEEVLSWRPQDRKKILAAVGQAGFNRFVQVHQNELGGEYETHPDDDLPVFSEDLYGWRNDEWIRSDNELDPMVNVVECWYREFSHGSWLRNPMTGDVQEFDPDDPTDLQIKLMMTGMVEQFEGPVYRMRKTVFIGPVVIDDRPSPYNHQEFPFTICYGWRNRRSQLFHALVDRMIDTQDIVNRMFGKLYHTLATRQVWIEKGAADNVDDVAMLAAQPDAVIELNPGGLGKFKIEDGGDRIRQYQAMMMMANQLLGENSGTNDEMMGRESNARTGVAIETRIDRGNTVLAPFFDRIAQFRMQMAKKRMSLIQQYYSGPMSVRITDDPGAMKYAIANEPGSDGKVKNDITTLTLDMVISESREKASVRQAMAETMWMIVGKLPPEYQAKIIPMAVEMTDPPNKEAWLQQLGQAQQEMQQRMMAEYQGQAAA